MPSCYPLTDKELDDLECEHRHTSDKRYADRVKTVYLLGKVWPVTKIAEALMIDRETVRNHFIPIALQISASDSLSQCGRGLG